MALEMDDFAVVKQEVEDVSFGDFTQAKGGPLRATAKQKRDLQKFFDEGNYRSKEEVQSISEQIGLPVLWIQSWMTRTRVSKGVARPRRPNGWRSVPTEFIKIEDDDDVPTPVIVSSISERQPKKRRRGPNKTAPTTTEPSSNYREPLLSTPNPVRLTIRLPARPAPSTLQVIPTSRPHVLPILAPPPMSDSLNTSESSITIPTPPLAHSAPVVIAGSRQDVLTTPTTSTMMDKPSQDPPVTSDSSVTPDAIPSSEPSRGRSADLKNPHAGAFRLYQQYRQSGASITSTPSLDNLATAIVPSSQESSVPNSPVIVRMNNSPRSVAAPVIIDATQEPQPYYFMPKGKGRVRKKIKSDPIILEEPTTEPPDATAPTPVIHIKTEERSITLPSNTQVSERRATSKALSKAKGRVPSHRGTDASTHGIVKDRAMSTPPDENDLAVPARSREGTTASNASAGVESPPPPPPLRIPVVYQGVHTFMFDPEAPPRTEDQLKVNAPARQATPGKTEAYSLRRLLTRKSDPYDFSRISSQASALVYTIASDPSSEVMDQVPSPFRLIAASWY